VRNLALSQGAHLGKALDLGCGLGGSTFSLAAKEGGFESVTGVELSHNFVKVAQELQRDGNVPYQIRLEGDQLEDLAAQVPAEFDRERVRFVQGDACNPGPEWAISDGQPAYDAILMGNVVCRLPNPAKVLNSLASMVTPGGVLMLTSPFSWKPEFTDRDLWLGGKIHGKERGSEGVKAVLEGAGFDLVDAYDSPLTIRHHARFYELIGAHATLWTRR